MNILSTQKSRIGIHYRAHARPETVEVGSNVLAGADSDKILKCAKMMFYRENSWENPFGAGMQEGRLLKL